MEKPEWIWLGICLALFWAASLATVWYWTRRRLLKSLLEQELREEPAPNAVSELRPEDEAARQLVRARRRQYLLKLWPETQLSLQAISDLCVELIREIARIYYPNEEHPELKASLADLVALYQRVGERLSAWLETFPMRTVKDVEIRTVLHYHEKYQSFKNHPVTRFVERHRLHKLAKWSWAVVNYNSPFYWSRQAAYEASRRLLLAKVADLVGEEAIRLYGRR
jgi:hypothetical protein